MTFEKRTLRLPAPVAVSVALLIAAVAVIFIVGHEPKTAASSSVARVVAPQQGTPAVVVPVMPEKVLLRPLPVSLSTATHEWTSEDATDPAVMERLAHNPDEFIRLAEENSRIKRRQLVYRRVTVPMLIERANGGSLKQITLPGMDGREVEVVVTETRLSGANAGSVIGRVRGRLNSMVSVGFFNGCESFNIISPEEGLYLTADAREPGEILVKEIDPEEYVPPTQCQPIVTGQQAPVLNR